MTKKSAGILLFRYKNHLPEVLLMHSGGPYWEEKDLGAWSIPKGELEENEITWDAAKREFEEETGIKLSGSFIELKPVIQNKNKIVYAWAKQQDLDPAGLKSNSFEIEWPPKSGKRASFPEMDRAEWFTFDEAGKKIIPGQKPLLIELEQKLKDGLK